MTDDVLDFLDDEKAEEIETPEVEAEQTEEVEQPETEEPEAEGETTAEPPAASEDKGASVPITALMDEREKRQAAQREAEEYRARIAEYERNAQPQEKPDFYDNPEAMVQQQVTQARLQQSRFFAEKEYGADLVNEAYAYFDQHPDQSQALLNEPSPFHAAVEFYKRQKTLSEMGPDPDAYINAQVEARLAERLAQSPTPKAPPPSMAKAPSTGGQKITPGTAFDEVFG